MNERTWLKSLDDPAAPLPRVDVTSRVMGAVRACRERADDDRTFKVSAVVAVAAGVIALGSVAPAWKFAGGVRQTPAQPFVAFGEVVNLVLR